MNRLSKILEEIHEIKLDLAKHIMRSEMNEQRIETMEDVYSDLKDHLLKVSGAISAFKWVGGCLGFIYLLSQIYDRLV